MPDLQKPRLVILTAPGVPEPHNLADLQCKTDIVLATAESLETAMQGADIVLLWDFFSSALRDAWAGADSLKWVHVAAAGVDAILFPDLVRSEVQLTNAHGTFDAPIAEFALASVLAHDKQIHLSHDLQHARRWTHRETARTGGSRALIIGTGGIGRKIARLFRAVGIEVRGAGRTRAGEDPDFGTVLPTAELTRHVGWADHVVVIAPLTEQTRGVINAEVLAAMKPTAHLINVARGQLVDEEALIAALRAGSIAAASLDVVAVEPLPPESPLWELEQVHLSAHMSGDVAGWRNDLADQFADNLDRWLAGSPLAHRVDKTLGYVPRPAMPGPDGASPEGAEVG